MVAQGLTEEKDGSRDASKHPPPHAAYGGSSVSLTDPCVWLAAILLLSRAAGHSSLLYKWSSQRGPSQDESLGTHSRVGGIGIGDHRKTFGSLQESLGSKGRKRAVCRGYTLQCEGWQSLVKEEGIREGIAVGKELEETSRLDWYLTVLYNNDTRDRKHTCGNGVTPENNTVASYATQKSSPIQNGQSWHLEELITHSRI